MKRGKQYPLLLLCITLSLLFSGCVYRRPMEPAATQAPTMVPVTHSPAPTDTPLPTDSPVPTDTPTPEPVAVATDAPAHVPDMTPEPTSDPTEPPVSTEVPADTTDWYQHMLNTSILSEGTNGRLEKVLTKIRSGEPVNIMALGGSVTEGAGAIDFTYSYGEQFIYALQETYPDSQIHYYNSGLGGTPSTLGLMRYERDVTQVIGDNPDLVIIEFAVNDYQEPTKARAYESLVRTVLEKENAPAVILLFSVFQSKWNLQSEYIPIGNHYGLPMVSIKDAIATAYAGNHLTDKEFFADIYHPTNYGHEIMANCLEELCTRVAAKGTTDIAPLPDTSIKGSDFVDMRLVTSADSAGTTITPGSFTGKDYSLQTYSRTAKAAFPDNWMRTGTSGTESFKMELTCKNIMLSYKFSNSSTFGKVSVYIDGHFVAVLNGYLNGGWNNTETVLLLDTDTSAPHVLEIKPAEGHETKNFTILGIGYTP